MQKKIGIPRGKTRGRQQDQHRLNRLYAEAHAKLDQAADLESIIASMELMRQVLAADPTHQEALAYSICYLALPTFLGGDTNLGKTYLEKSIAKGKGYLLPTWGRGKYFHQVTGDLKSARKDLLWVASRKPEDYKDLYPWRVYFITDAKLELDTL